MIGAGFPVATRRSSSAEREVEKVRQRILRTLATGGRKANVLRGLAPSDAAFAQAIGLLFLKGFIVAKGKTGGRLIVRNGRRSKR